MIRNLRASDILVVTTSSIEGWEVEEYYGPVTAEAVIGTGLFTDVFASFTDLFGSYSGSYQSKLQQVQGQVLTWLRQKSLFLGANAVIGVRIDADEISAAGKSLLMVTASGTAVRVRQRVTIAPSPNAPRNEGAVSLAEVSAELRRGDIAAKVNEGTFDIGDTDTWEFLISNRVAELAAPIVSLFTSDYYRSTMPEYRNSFVQYLRSLEPEYVSGILFDLLVARADTEQAKTVAAIIEELDLFEPKRLKPLLQSDSVGLRTLGLNLCRTEKQSYTGSDERDIIELAETIVRTFVAAPEHEEKRTFGGKVRAWTCPSCGQSMEVGYACKKCHITQFGLRPEAPNPFEVASELRRTASGIGRAFARRRGDAAVDQGSNVV